MFELFMYVYSYCNALSARFFAVDMGTKLLYYDYDYDHCNVINIVL